MKTIAVIGLGSIGMRHVKNLREMGHHVWGYDPDPKKETEFGNPKFPPTRDNLLGAHAIVIASPTDHHYDDIYAALQRNMNVFVEKPIAHSLEEPHDPSLLRQVKMVGYNLRFHACVLRAKEWIASGEIGRPLWANFTLGQHSEKPPYLRDGVILNWSHEIDLALHLLGAADLDGSSTLLRDGKDTMTDILLTHKTGCRTVIHLDYMTKPEHRNFTIAGDEGSLRVDLVKHCAGLLHRHHLDPKGFFIAPSGWDYTYVDEMKAFLDRCDDKETLGCTGQEGLDVLKICSQVRQQAGLE